MGAMSAGGKPLLPAADHEDARTRALQQMPQAPQSRRLITKAELRRIVPYTPQHILRLEKRGMFPRRVRLGPNRVAWLLAETEQWVAALVAERDAAAQRAVEQRMQIAYQNEKRTHRRR
jgi:prophage regulatory protein